MFFLHSVLFLAPRLHFHQPELPHGSVFVTLVKGGFVLIAVAIVLVIAMRNGGGASQLRKNKSKNSRPSRSKTNELGSGDLATKAQISRWLERRSDSDTVLPVRDLKGSDGIACKQGHLIIPQEERNRHILVIAKTGSGKTTRAILPVLYNDCLSPERSTIVLDSKPEMWDKLVGMTKKFNPKKRILLFNPLNLDRGLSWNILAKIQTDTDAKLIANTVISATDSPTAKSDTPFFRNNALSLLNSIMVGLLSDSNEKLSMPRVHQLINCGMEPLCKWLEAHPNAIRNSKTFVDLARSGSQNADTIMSELGMRLAAWDLTTIRATTALDELDLRALIDEPTLLIIELRESELEMLRPMANVIVVEMLRYLTKVAESCPGQTLPRPVSLVIDEFASALGRLPDIHVKLNTLRSRNVSIVAAIQSIAQIKANYDRDADSVLAGFSTKIFMPNLDFQDSEWASKETGVMTVRYNVTSIGKNKRMIDYFATRNDNLQEQVQQRAVLTPDEIGRPVDNAATFFLPNMPVFQGHLLPYFEVSEMSAKFNAGRGVDFKLRESPIEYIEQAPLPSEPAARTASPADIQKQIAEARQILQFDHADAMARQWWEALEKLNEKTPQAVINLTQQLVRRGISIGDFYTTYVNSGVDNVEDLIKHIDSALLVQFRTALGYSSANQHAQDWWMAFEEANKENTLVIIELAQELLRRGVSIDDFFAAYVHSDVNSVPELLQVLDQSLEEIRRRAASPQPAPVQNTDAAIHTNTNGAHVSAQPAIEAPPEPPALSAPLQQQIHVEVQPVEYPVHHHQNGNDHFVPAALNSEPPPVEEVHRVKPTGRTLQPIVSSREQKERAAKSVHLNSYIEMGRELLERGKTEDFNKLLEMARADTRIPADCVNQLESLRGA